MVTVAACASAICSADETFASPWAAAHYCEPALDIFEMLVLAPLLKQRYEVTKGEWPQKGTKSTKTDRR